MKSVSLFNFFFRYLYSPVIILILKYYKAKVGKNVYFSGTINFEFKKNLENLEIHDGVCFWGDNLVKLRDNSKVIIHENVRIGKYTQLIAANNKTLSIGKRTAVGHLCNLVAGDNLNIGDDCLLASNVGVYCSDHIYFDANINILQQGYTHKPIHIGNDCLLSANCTILKGTVLENGSIIGANSVVNGNIEAYSINVGNPLKIIKYRENIT